MKFVIEKEDKKLSPGIYNFEIIDASDYISKSDNPMIKIVLKIGDQFFTDYLFKSWKIHQVLTAIGLLDNLEKGEVLPIELLNKHGKVELKNEFDVKYGDRLKITKYFPLDAQDSINETPVPLKTTTQPEAFDDIPF